MPPFKEEGVYCFAHVGLSVRPPGGFRMIIITQERLGLGSVQVEVKFLNLCMLGNLSSTKMLSAEFLKLAFSLNFFKEYYKNSKQFGS